MVGTREPAVAGSFYGATAAQVRDQIEACFQHPLGPGAIPQVVEKRERRIAGLVVPHAGYVYSGPVAAHAYAALAADGRPEVAVIIGPDHRGLGPAATISEAEAWRTPLGLVQVDRALADAIAAELPWPTRDEVAHRYEHSLEVQLPFLQYLYGAAVPIVPIVMAEQSAEVAEALGKAIASALAGRRGVIIASTDLSHYETQAAALALDEVALAAIRERRPRDLVRVAEQGVSMCGPGPTAALLVACEEMGARTVTLLKHATSGDVAGDMRQVVGYAALTVTA